MRSVVLMKGLATF